MLDILIGRAHPNQGALNYTPRRLVWVASGRNSFSNNDPKLRSLRDRGLEFTGGHLEL